MVYPPPLEPLGGSSGDVPWRLALIERARADVAFLETVADLPPMGLSAFKAFLLKYYDEELITHAEVIHCAAERARRNAPF